MKNERDYGSEWLDVVDETGEPTGETVERRRAHAEGIRHRTSHVWLLRRRENRVEILIQKRSETKDSFPGCYDISSAGHIPAGDGFEGSALRELSEELGVEAESDELIFVGNRSVRFDAVFHGEPFHDRQVSRVFLLWCDREADRFSLQAEEISEVRWIVFEDLILAVEEGLIPTCIDRSELEMIRRFLDEETD